MDHTARIIVQGSYCKDHSTRVNQNTNSATSWPASQSIFHLITVGDHLCNATNQYTHSCSRSLTMGPGGPGRPGAPVGGGVGVVDGSSPLNLSGMSKPFGHSTAN